MAISLTLSSQSFRNAASSGLAALLIPALYFAATPFLLGRLGAETFGVWTLLSVLFTFAALADFGIGPTTTLYVARYRGKQVPQELLQVIQTAWGIYLMLMLLLTLALYFLGFPLLGLLGVPPNILSTLEPVLSVFVLGVTMQFTFSVLDGVIRGFERYDLSSLLKVGSGAAIVIVSCIIVALGGSLREMIICKTLILLILVLVGVVMVGRLLGGYAWLIPRIRVARFREILTLSVYGWLQSLAATLSNQADRLLVSVFLGPAVLAYYAACLQLAQLAHSILAQTLGFTFPKFASLATNKAAQLTIFNRGMFFATVLGAGASLVLFIWAPLILELWLGKGIPPKIDLALRLLAFSNAFTSTSIMPSYLMFGLGHFRLAAFAALAGGLSVAIGGYFLVPSIGVAGAALSRLVGLPIAVINRMIVYQHAFGVFRWRLGFQQLAPVALAFVPAGLLLFVHSPQTAGLLGLLLSIAGFALGFLIAFTSARAIYK